MLNLNFSEKCPGLVSPPHFDFDFWRKMFFTVYSIKWPNFFVWLPLLLKILDNMCIAIVWEPGCDVINFEINVTFLIKSFCYMTKNSRQKFKYLENEKSFWGEIKSILHHFKRVFIAKNCQTWESTFTKFFDDKGRSVKHGRKIWGLWCKTYNIEIRKLM